MENVKEKAMPLNEKVDIVNNTQQQIKLNVVKINLRGFDIT